jgi:hypothetical protein
MHVNTATAVRDWIRLLDLMRKAPGFGCERKFIIPANLSAGFLPRAGVKLKIISHGGGLPFLVID